MWILLNLLLGLPILLTGLARRRPRAVASGAALVLFAAVDVLIAYLAIRDGRPMPDISLHAVFLLPVALTLAVLGARSLRG